MAENPTNPDPSQNGTDWVAAGEGIYTGIAKHVTFDDFSDAIVNGLLKGLLALAKGVGKVAAPVAELGGTALVAMEEPVLPILAAFVAPIVANLFGTDAPTELFAARGNREGRGEAARAIVDAYLKSITGDSGETPPPGDEGAKRIAGAAVHAALEGWFNELIPELLGDMIPIDWMHFPAFTGLSEEVISALGVGRLTRRAFTPFVNIYAVNPLTNYLNATHRPKKLSESTALRQFLRGKWEWADAANELATIGYDDVRIEALLNELSKFHTPAEVYDLERNSVWTHDQAIQHLRDAGYDQDRAELALRLEGVRRIDAQNRELATAAIEAFVRGGVDDGQLDAFLTSFNMPATDVALYQELAHAKRRLKLKPLTPAEAKACVVAGILAPIDYTAALVRDGYTQDAADALELLLRKELDDKQTVAEHRRAQADAKAAADTARTAAAAAKKAEIEQARAVKAQGSIAELEHAAVIGLIPISRLAQTLAAQFTPDTVAIYVADVEQKRQTYLADEKKRADAATRAANKGLSLGSLEQAVYENAIPLDKFAAILAQQQLAAADVAILVATVTAKKADLDAAKKKRAEADLRASQKKINLGRMEQLVERGIRPMADYDALLTTLGYDDASRAALDQLLEAKVTARTSAAGVRAGVSAANPTKGLSLAQMRQAVIRDEQTFDDFSTFLMADGYTTDAQAVLVAELRDDVAVADAARARRSQGDTTGGAAYIPLTVAARAARLGILTPAAYQARLEAGGYSADDVAIEMDLLTAEIAKTASSRSSIAGAVTPIGVTGLTLAQVGAAVKTGAATIGDYQAAAAARGLRGAAVQTLVAVLQDEIAAIADGKSRRAQILQELTAQNVSLPELEAPVLAGTMTVSAFEQRLTGDGYSDADAQLIGHLLEVQLEAAAAPSGG